MASLHTLSTAQLRQALHLREQIESLEAKLGDLLGSSSTKAEPAVAKVKGKRKLSPAARARIAAAQKARWAKVGRDTAKTVTAKPAGRKRAAFTPERRAKLAAAMKARWAARKNG